MAKVRKNQREDVGEGAAKDAATDKHDKHALKPVVKLDPETHRYLATLAVFRQETMGEVVAALVREALERSREEMKAALDHM